MPVNPNAQIEITAFEWVPDFAKGVVRDLRVRWALEEAGLDYRVRLLGQQRPTEYLTEQPFDQVPVFRDGRVHIFESGAIVQYIGEQHEVLLPRDPQQRFRAIQWTYAALNSVEPAILNLLLIDLFYTNEEWAKLRRPGAEDFARLKLKRVSDWLGDRQWLEGDRFTIGDLLMVTVLRFLRHTGLVAEFPNLKALVARGEARTAFQRALADQLAAFEEHEPQAARPTQQRRATMTYFEGFVAAVPEANKETYRQHAADAAPIFKEFGVKRHFEAWDSDVPEGKVTDFRKAVEAKPDEKVVFAWFEYPDKATRDSANEKMRSDPRMKDMGENMPFDGKRMIYGGFDSIVEEGSGQGAYTDGFVVPVPQGKTDAYQQLAAKMAKVFRQHGATRVVEALSDDVPKGEVTDFYRAVKAEGDEKVVFSFIEWPDKETRDQAWQKIMADESLKPEGDMPFNGQRMFWGGFEPIFDTAKSREPAHA